ncbi:MAG: diaminopimelate decarboxylase [Rickettsiales bacterium]|jgi:diaminopimelate decarboxylase|nr:diaminopimelate decarboxylase [Rickettsiales bacterium]
MDHFHYANGIYHAEDVSLELLAREIGTPFYCYSNATLERHYKIFAAHFEELDAKICYAVKANSNLGVLATLSKLGSGADVVSEGEIRLAQAAGIRSSDIVFSGVGKTASEMAYALSQGIYQFNVESEPELDLLNEVAGSMAIKAPVAIRINPDVDPKTHAKISTGQKESKFGISAKQAHHAFRYAAKLPHLDVQGVSVHIGSQLTSIEPFAAAFRHVRNFVFELRSEGFSIRTVDLGGGLGIPYGEAEPPVPDSYAETVRREMQGINAKLIFEPGRLIVGNAGVLVSRVIYVKKSESRTFVIVDAAMNDLIRPTLYDAYHEIIPVKESNAEKMAVDVVGPVCETGDIFAEARKMSPVASGDLVVFRSAGAYGAVMANTYNARLLVPEVMVRAKEHAVIRARPDYESLIRRDHIPDWI